MEDFDSQEEMWEVLGRDNAAAVHALVGAAAALDRAYCGQLQGLALLSRARRLLAGDDSDAGAAGQRLLALLRDEPALAIARDMEGRSLWHDLAAAGSDGLLRMLLPAVAAAVAGDADAAAGGQQQQGATEQEGQAQGGRQQLDAQELEGAQAGRPAPRPNPLNLPDHNGNTPLHLAAEGSQLEAARLLVQAGASLDMQNRWAGRGPADVWRCRWLLSALAHYCLP